MMEFLILPMPPSLREVASRSDDGRSYSAAALPYHLNPNVKRSKRGNKATPNLSRPNAGKHYGHHGDQPSAGQAERAHDDLHLDPIFIFGYCGEALSGTTGAAVATVIGQFCGAGMTLFFNLNKNPDIQISFKGFRPSAKAIGRIYTVGLPSIAMQCVGSLMTFGMNLILMSFSATAVAVFGVYFKLQSFVFMPIFGLNNGMVPIISYNYGARRPDRVKKTIKLAVCYAECIMLIGFCIFQFAPDKVLGIFAASDAMLAIGIPAMRIICLHFLLAGASIVLSSVFQALGNGVFSLIVSVCRQLFVLLPAAWLLAQTGNVNNVWWAFLIAEIVSVLLSLGFYARINKNIIAPMYSPAE